jgi:Tol biopolymer transport system component
MTIQTTTRTRTRKSLLLGLGLGVALAGVAALGAPTRQADAAITEKVVFASDRTTGTGVNNPTGDFEIFRMNADGAGVRQLTTNKADDFGPVLAPDKTKVAYHSSGNQTSNPEGDFEVYRMNASDGTSKKNLTHNGDGLDEGCAVFSPDGKTIAYESEGFQTYNSEGDKEIYRMNALDGTGKKNLTDNAAIDVVYPD